MILLGNDNAGKILYAIASATRLPNGEVKSCNTYTHAANIQEATFNFVSSLPHHLRNSTTILAVGPAIGAFVEETKDKKIVVTAD